MSWRLAAGVVIGALLLRLLRAANRWDEVGWLYAAYPHRTVDALGEGRLQDALTAFSGLHPPLHSLLHASGELIFPVPALWLLFAAAASTLSVALLAFAPWTERAGERQVAAAVLTSAPVQLHYAAEFNGYPVLAAAVAGVWVAALAVQRGAHWGWLALAGAVAGWTHALGGLIAVFASLCLPRGLALRALGGMALAATPLLPGVIDLLGRDDTFRQVGLKPALVVREHWDRFGAAWMLAAPVALLGARRRPRVAAGWLLTALTILCLTLAGVAAPHQFPYQVALGAPAAILVAAGLRERTGQRLALGLAITLGAFSAVAQLEGLNQTRLDLARERAIDVALAELAAPWTCGRSPGPGCAGDALYLLSPPGPNDDDKRRRSAVLWRLSPFQAMARVPLDHPGWGASSETPPGEPSWGALQWGDHKSGHPRLVGGHVVYLNDHLRPELAKAIAHHPRLWLVVYGQGARAGYTREVQALVGVAPEDVGGDHLYRLSSARSEDWSSACSEDLSSEDLSSENTVRPSRAGTECRPPAAPSPGSPALRPDP